MALQDLLGIFKFKFEINLFEFEMFKLKFPYLKFTTFIVVKILRLFSGCPNLLIILTLV